MNRVEEFCNHPCPEVICLELISKRKSKVASCGKYSKRMVNTFHAIKRNYTQLLIVVNVAQHDLLLSCFFGIANLRIAQPLLLSGPIQNRFKRLYFWLMILSDLAKGVVAPSRRGCTTAYTVGT